jgi:RIO kinase 2
LKNHDLVPTDLIVKIGKLHRGGTFKAINNIHKHKLVYHENKIYDGYRLTYLGYDFLCLKAMSMRDEVVSVGSRIGVGKESDIFACAGPEDEAYVLKLARLGRISFRNIKNKRDYLVKRKAASWLYMSRLAAFREWTYMQILYKHELPIPKPIDWSRHGVLMERVDGYNLAGVDKCLDAEKMYVELMELILKFASFGLIHCDFNEFNLMVSEEGKITVIDFPQMVSVTHLNAQFYFERDVNCIVTFFKKRFQFECDFRAKWEDVKVGDVRLDVIVKASGVDSGEGLPGHDDESAADQDRPDEGDLDGTNSNSNNNNNNNEEEEETSNSNSQEEEEGESEEDQEAEKAKEVELSAKAKERKEKKERMKEKKAEDTKDQIRANVRKEIRKGKEQKVFKSSKRQGKRQTQRTGQRAVKNYTGDNGGW